MTLQRARIIFHSHMSAAQKRKLTAYEKGQLDTARAVLRQWRGGRLGARYREATRRPNAFREVDIDPTLRAKQLEQRKSSYVRALKRIARDRESRYASTARLLLMRPSTHWTRQDLEEAYRVVRAYSHGGMALRRNPGKYTRRKTGKKVARIYDGVLRIEAQKGRRHNNCDIKCAECGHKYFHDFRGHKKIKMLGLHPGQVFKVPAGCWPLLIIG